MIALQWKPYEGKTLPPNETAWLAFVEDTMVGCIRGTRRVWRACMAGDVVWRVILRGKSSSAPAAKAAFVSWIAGRTTRFSSSAPTRAA